MTTKVSAVLVTYRRSHLLPLAFERLAAQGSALGRLIVVDNDPECGANKTVGRFAPTGIEVEYVGPGNNLGPAGGFALGMQHILQDAHNDEAILVLDDNDHLPPFDAVGEQVVLLDNLAEEDPQTAGVGLYGGTFDFRSGRAQRARQWPRDCIAPADHLHGGGYPMYRVAALREVGTFATPLFFGFEELEFGLRLTTSGYRLYMNGPLAQQQQTWRRQELQSHSKPMLGLGPISWRRYYSLRNLLYILLLHGFPRTAAKVAAVRGMAKPIANFVGAPRLSVEHIRWNCLAISDAFTGRMGRTVDPPF